MAYKSLKQVSGIGMDLQIIKLLLTQHPERVQRSLLYMEGANPWLILEQKGSLHHPHKVFDRSPERLRHALNFC
ncbi:hypothetical protein C5167_046758, partial [Papaver somniferum]